MHPTHFGKYEVTRLLGQGGFATVFLGRDPILRRQVAVKVSFSLSTELRQRFIREAEVIAWLHHPNITTLFDFGEQDGVLYLVEEYLEGEDLSEIIRRRAPLPLACKLRYLLEVARGLEHAHSLGIVHRDIKPDNLRILADGSVKILDFGIAKLMTGGQVLTLTGGAIGTPGYLAPEQLRGGQVDHRADQFSFGSVAYEFLTYAKPFPGNKMEDLLTSVMLRGAIPVRDSWPGCPTRLASWIERCLAKSPDARYASFSEVIADLEPLIASLDPSAPALPEPMALRSTEAFPKPAVAPPAASALSSRPRLRPPIVERVSPRLPPTERLPAIVLQGEAPRHVMGKFVTAAALLALPLVVLLGFRGQQSAPLGGSGVNLELAGAPGQSTSSKVTLLLSLASDPGQNLPGSNLARARATLAATLVESGRLGVAALPGDLAQHGDGIEAERIAATGRREGAQVVLVGKLKTEILDDEPDRSGCRATLHLRLYGSADGALLLNQEVVAEGIGATSAEARITAAEEVASRAADLVLRHLGSLAPPGELQASKS